MEIRDITIIIFAAVANEEFAGKEQEAESHKEGKGAANHQIFFSFFAADKESGDNGENDANKKQTKRHPHRPIKGEAVTEIVDESNHVFGLYPIHLGLVSHNRT